MLPLLMPVNQKNVINLDTYSNQNGFYQSRKCRKYVEKGWDEEKQMYYYLVYFNKEENRKISFSFIFSKASITSK
jgi:hypothetical protein